MNIPPNLFDRNEYRHMVHWFSPSVLLKIVRKVILSTIFGEYADRRLVHAALTAISPETVVKDCCGGEDGLFAAKDGEPVWVDYVADLGDGFDSTYAIAYLIGQKEILIDGLKLPRADCLIMGGDEVYPDASRDDYEIRMQRPYEFAFPRNSHSKIHPPVYLIPGNHDWYDGLTLFLAKFCRGRATKLGNWTATQSRSYFAVHLAENWWIWGFDSQLGDDIDKPQADYFVAVAKKMAPNAKVILCASVPSWLKADLDAPDKHEREAYFRSIDYVANIIRDECKGARIPLVLSGDLHHYSRYVAKEIGTSFITAGGGGAFLHPTHHLKDKLSTIFARNKVTLEIGTGEEADKKAFYPSQKTSRRLAFGNIKFVTKNLDFCLLLGTLYFACGLSMLAWTGYGAPANRASFWTGVFERAVSLVPTPIFLLVTLVLFGLLYKAASDVRSTSRKVGVVALHFLTHLMILLFGTAFISVAAFWLQFFPLGDILYFVALFFGIEIFGIAGGAVWGIYLVALSWIWGDDANDAFSAMRLDSYRHFLRLKIETDQVTIYPIGVHKSPERQDWAFNPAYQPNNEETPVVVPKGGLGQRLIENPFEIDIHGVKPLVEIQ